MIRAIVDPGVFIAALIAPAGTCGRTLQAWQEGAFQLVVRPALVSELEDVLLREKFRRWLPSASDGIAFVELLRLSAELRDDPVSTERFSRYEDDDYLIRLLIETRANVIVSGDNDLLSLHEPPRSAVVAPSRFRRFIEEHGRVN